MTHGGLFAGIGGFELGAQMAGIKTIWSCEIEPYNQSILKRHFPHTIIYNDIKTLSRPSAVTIISGGFPCQDISISGKGRGITASRSSLWFEMYRIIEEIRPIYILIENSPELLKKGFEKVLYPLSEIGYNVEWECLPNSAFGFPHHRERVYIIAYSCQKRFLNNHEKGRIFKKIPIQQTPEQNNLLLSVKRYDSKSDYESVRMDVGFSTELDKSRIAACGNAVNPIITKYLFECILQFDKNLITT